MEHPKLAVIVHGWGGSPSDGWFPWLKAELEARGYDVIVPAMPNTHVPEITAWVDTLKTILADNPAQDILLVGHSIGCQTILRYLAGAYVPVDKAIFVAGWTSLTGLTEDEQIIARPWLEIPINTEAVRSHLKHSTALFSTDDPVVPLEPNRQFFKDQVGSQVVTLNGYSHFDEEGGIMSIPELPQYI